MTDKLTEAYSLFSKEDQKILFEQMERDVMKAVDEINNRKIVFVYCGCSACGHVSSYSAPYAEVLEFRVETLDLVPVDRMPMQ